MMASILSENDAKRGPRLQRVSLCFFTDAALAFGSLSTLRVHGVFALCRATPEATVCDPAQRGNEPCGCDRKARGVRSAP